MPHIAVPSFFYQDMIQKLGSDSQLLMLSKECSYLSYSYFWKGLKDLSLADNNKRN